MEHTDGMRISAPSAPLDPEVMAKLRDGLERCPDLAFAHLTQVLVEERQESASLVLFVWLKPAALRSLRSALNLVSEVVAAALPSQDFVDVVILNSAPELIEAVEAAECLIAEPDPEERRRTLHAARNPEPEEPVSSGRWWWPF